MGKATLGGSQRRRAAQPLRGRRAGHAWKLTERESGEPRTGSANGNAVRAANPRSNAAMNGQRQSDRCVVPWKAANKGGAGAQLAEWPEGRDLPKGNPQEQTNRRTQDRERLQQALERVRQAAKKDKGKVFTNLWHHVYDEGRLREAYYGLKRKSAPGVDGRTWREYQDELESNLENLSQRLRRGSYRAKPVKRHYLPKPDGRQRPIGIPVLEDKIVQRATAEVLNAIYEERFLGFSHGFRPGRKQHDALDALYVGITQRKVNWLLDADISGFFDAMVHEWLVRFMEHQIQDQRVIRHIKKWLKAGILEEEEYRRSEEGSPQGGSISPLLSNVYLHYVLDLWVKQWRKKHSRGEVIVVRYADDFVMGFQYRSDAEQMRSALFERLAHFGLTLHPQKTRLIEFGRFAASNRKQRGEGKPETFDFLGFTHICSRTKRGGRYALRRQSMKKRFRAKLAELKEELRRRMHEPIPRVGSWLRSVIMGHNRYHAVPGNMELLERFRRGILRHWYRTLKRRSDKSKITWPGMYTLADKWLPRPRIYHPYPNERLRVRT